MQVFWTSRPYRTPSNLPGGSASAGPPPFWFPSMITAVPSQPTANSTATDYGPDGMNDITERGIFFVNINLL